MFWASISANVLILSPVAKARPPADGRSTVVLSNLLELGQALDVIDVGMRGDDRFAIRQRKIELADHFHDFIDGFIEADVDQQPFGLVVHQIDVATQPLARLIVHLDDVRKDRLPLEHGYTSFDRSAFVRQGFPTAPRF